MPAHPKPLLRTLLAAALACAATAALADDKAAPSKALRRAQMEAARAQQEKAQLETEKDELASQLGKAQATAKKDEAEQKAVRGQLGSLRHALGEARARADALRAQDEARLKQANDAMAETVRQANDRFDHYEAEITTLRQHLADSEARGQKLDQQLRLSEADRIRLTSDLGERSEGLASCAKKNADLFALNAALRKQYQDKGFLSMLKRSEPLTGLGKVQEENAMQDAEDKAYDAKLVPAAH